MDVVPICVLPLYHLIVLAYPTDFGMPDSVSVAFVWSILPAASLTLLYVAVTLPMPIFPTFT